MESHSHHFRKNFSNDNQKKENDMELDLFDHYYNFYKEDDEYYLNKIFSFIDEQNEDEKENFFPFLFSFWDFEEEQKKKVYNKENEKNIFSMEIRDDNDKFSFQNEANGKNQINIISSNIKIHNNKGEEIMEKISNYISNYQEILHNQTAVKSQSHFDIERNVKLAEKTLPGSIISLLKKEGDPIDIDYIYEKIKDQFLSFLKANGSKYHGDIHKVLESTLYSSGIFYKVSENTYYFNEKESIYFIIKTIERELKKKISKDKKK